MAPLCRELATTHSAGIPLLQGLHLASQHGGTMKTRQMLERMEAAIIDGDTLAEAARKEHKLLPEMFVEVVAAGEIGGRLDDLFHDLADYYEGVWKMQRATTAVLVYPALQLIMAWFLGTFALGLVGMISPTATERFDLGTYLSAYAAFQAKALGIAAVGVAILIVLARMGMLRMPWTLIKTAIPPLRYILNKFAMARFFRTLSLLVGSGLNIRQCIERSAAVTLNPLIERDLLRAIPVIMRGGTLVEAFSGCRYINRVGKEMIAVGEHSGRLDAALRKVAEYHYDEAQAAVSAAARILFVASVLIVGVIIGAIVIRFYGSLYGSMLDGI